MPPGSYWDIFNFSIVIHHQPISVRCLLIRYLQSSTVSWVYQFVYSVLYFANLWIQFVPQHERLWGSNLLSPRLVRGLAYTPTKSSEEEHTALARWHIRRLFFGVSLLPVQSLLKTNELPLFFLEYILIFPRFNPTSTSVTTRVEYNS